MINSNYCPYALYKLELGKKPYTYCRHYQKECHFMVKENCDARDNNIRHQQLRGLARILSSLRLR